MPNLPRYQSHKIVEAAPIIAYDRNAPTIFVRIDQAETVRIEVPSNFFARGIPDVGDYFVRYEDGYVSWSPKEAFEAGYRLA
jgi:hypothetical protein